jgi:hypothetical protein
MLAINCSPFKRNTFDKNANKSWVRARVLLSSVFLLALTGSHGLAQSGADSIFAPPSPAIAAANEEDASSQPAGSTAVEPVENSDQGSGDSPVAPPSGEENGNSSGVDESAASTTEEEGPAGSDNVTTDDGSDIATSPPAPVIETPAPVVAAPPALVEPTPAEEQPAPAIVTNEKYATQKQLNDIAALVLTLQQKLETLGKSSEADDSIASINAAVATLRKDVDKLAADKTAEGDKKLAGDEATAPDQLDVVTAEVLNMAVELQELKDSSVSHDMITDINTALKTFKEQIAKLSNGAGASSEPASGRDVDAQLDERLNQIERRLAQIELAMRNGGEAAPTRRTVEPNVTAGGNQPTPVRPDTPDQPDVFTAPFELLFQSDGKPALLRSSVVKKQYLMQLANAGQCKEIGGWLGQTGIKLDIKVVFVQRNKRVLKCQYSVSGKWRLYPLRGNDPGYVALPNGG